MDITTDAYKRVPLTLRENLEFRKKIRLRAASDVGFQRLMMEACRRDVLFFFGAFSWLYEPRPRKLNGVELPKKIPFIPWPHQEPVILALREALGYRDCILQKSRSEGGSFVSIWLAIHDYVFKPMTAIGMVSKSLEAADNVESSDSLGWKLDWGS